MKIAKQAWSKPSEVEECISSFSFNATLRDNVVDVVSRIFDQFHTSTSFHLNMPAPYADSTVDILGELRRIRATVYKSDFEVHQDVSKTVKRLGDGHANYFNYCYDSLYVTYLPFPLAVLESSSMDGTQNIYIVPEAFEVVTKEFGDEAVKAWQSALGRNLSDFNGAQIVLINGEDPWVVVDSYATVSGNFQARSIRQNSFFASYRLSKYRMGDFAQSPWPTRGDTISLTIIRNGTTAQEIYRVPYLSRIGSATVAFSDAQSLWESNCRATRFTNADYPSADALLSPITETKRGPPDGERDGAQSNNKPQIVDGRPLATSALTLDGRQDDPSLPDRLFPTGEVSAMGSMYWFILEDEKTAVLWLPTFQGNFRLLRQNVLDGIKAVKARGATRLLIDLSNNEGGTICLAEWLHRVLAGPQDGLDHQAGFDGSIRAQNLPQKIVAKLLTSDPESDAAVASWYNPSHWNSTKGQEFPANFNWLDPPIDMQVNGVADKFSQKVGDQCLPFASTPPTTKPFEFENIAIMSNGRCASACSLFSILMHTKYNVKTVVVGGKPQVPQEYCGFVGGQALNYVTLDSEVKAFGLKDDPLAPPNFLTNSYQGELVSLVDAKERGLTIAGVNWRLAWSLSDPNTFEEFKSHTAQFSFPLLPSTVNNPRALWGDHPWTPRLMPGV
ncbi:Peptidase family s41 domain containing protein [Ceratobasidium theobromae]|uniref:Peptidase family s41 domain containing protein n=1 Tax=Ceratobasidium theobromae TaxID=1582974 RepID=A0A5N5Q8F5_9AGAM|nr:Peptidase family s41 domain containing protein [Ceratobasidium theobromae]